MKKCIIIGGGAAGMYSAIIAASGGMDVSIWEKNEKLGKKLFIREKAAVILRIIVRQKTCFVML